MGRVDLLVPAPGHWSCEWYTREEWLSIREDERPDNPFWVEELGVVAAYTFTAPCGGGSCQVPHCPDSTQAVEAQPVDRLPRLRVIG